MQLPLYSSIMINCETFRSLKLCLFSAFESTVEWPPPVNTKQKSVIMCFGEIVCARCGLCLCVLRASNETALLYISVRVRAHLPLSTDMGMNECTLRACTHMRTMTKKGRGTYIHINKIYLYVMYVCTLSFFVASSRSWSSGGSPKLGRYSGFWEEG